MSATTFSQIARERAVRVASREAIDAVLLRLGPETDRPFDSLDRDRRSHLVSRFVRHLPGVGVHEGALLEHDLAEALGLMSKGRQVVAIQNAISLIALRNHLHEVVTRVGLSWSDGMVIQSAVSEIARNLVEHGGGTIEMMVDDERHVAVTVYAKQDLGAIPNAPGPTAPTWIAGALNIARQFHSTRGSAGTRLDFTFDRMPAAVA